MPAKRCGSTINDDQAGVPQFGHRRGHPGSTGEIVIMYPGDRSNRQPHLEWLLALATLVLAPAVSAQIDLQAFLDGPAEYTPGDVEQYQLVVENQGSTTENAAGITTGFPAGFGIDWTCSGNGGATCDDASGTGNLDADADTIPMNGSVTYTLDVTFPSGLTDDPFTAQATVDPSQVGDTSDAFTVSDQSDREPLADVAISKTPMDSDYTPGDTGTLTVEVSNNGPTDATGLTLTDNAPAGMTINGWTCAGSGGASCPTVSGSGDLDEAIDVTAGGSLTYTLQVAYGADATVDPMVNTATLDIPAALNNPEGETESDQSSQDRDVVSDLRVTFANSPPDSYIPGTTGNLYDITLANDGPTDTTNALFSLDFPDAVEAWSCDPASACAANPDDDIEIMLDLAGGESRDVELSVDYDSSALADPLVLAPRLDPAVAADDPDDSNNQATLSLDIDRRADIQVVKTASAGTVSPNGEFLYFIEITNNGPSDVGNGAGETGLLLDDSFPGLLEGVAQDYPGNDGSQPCWYYCPSDNGQDGDVGPDACPDEVASGQGDIADLAMRVSAGNTSTLRAHVSAGNTASGTFTNTATVELASGEGVSDDDGGNNSDDAVVEVVIQSDFFVEKTDDAVTAVPGTEHSYEIRVGNGGFIGANDIRVSDAFPVQGGGVTAGFIAGSVSWQCQASNGACCNTNSSNCGLGSPTPPVFGDVLDQGVDLPADSEVVFTVTGTLHPLSAGFLSNTASIDIPDEIEDPVAANNTATDDDTEMTPEADLEITKLLLSPPTPVGVGAFELVYRIEVVNDGPSFIDDATVIDNLGDGQLDSTSASWSCSVIDDPGNTACGSPPDRTGSLEETVSLDPGGRIRFDLTVQTVDPASGEVANTAGVDSAAGDDQVTLTTSLTATTNLAVSVTDGRSEAAPGTGIEYFITVENTGTDDVFGATVSDTFPTVLQDVAWTCTAATPIPGDLSPLDTDLATGDAGNAVVRSADGRHVYVAGHPEDAVYVYDRDNVPGTTFGRVTLQETERDGIDDAQDPGAAVAGMTGPKHGGWP